MALADEVKVRITADTAFFEHSFEHMMDVLLIYALRELAFVMMMADSMRAAFGMERALERVEKITNCTPEDLHRMAAQVEKEMAARADQAALPEEEH